MADTTLNSARIVVRGGPVRVAAKVEVTTSGLLAIGALVSGVLLSTTALVWASTSPARRHPIATAAMRRR